MPILSNEHFPRSIFSALLAASAFVPLAMLPARPALAQLSVFDPTNYAQNLLSAGRALEQINNQIRSLQNEAAMLAGLAKNLSRVDFPQLAALRARLEEIDALMAEARGIGFRAQELDGNFRQLFPGASGTASGTGRGLAGARARLEASREAFRHTMGIQARIVENVRGDAEALAAIVERSQGAEGALQVGQATNQLLALAAKQQFQLQQLMAAQFRSDAVEQARRAQDGEEARAATRRFLGTGEAYTPR